MANLNLPYGIDNFEKIRINHCYYIDKTEFIKELLTETFDVNLITRPRRFGKTLTISMLAEFLISAKIPGRFLADSLSRKTRISVTNGRTNGPSFI